MVASGSSADGASEVALNATAAGGRQQGAGERPAVPLRIGLNLVYLAHGAGGAGTYARELVRGLLEEEPGSEITAFTSAEVPREFVETEWPGRVRFVRLPVTVTHGPPGSFALNVAAQWGAIPLVAARRRLDVVHGLANVTPLFAPRVATVVTLLDLIWMHHPTTMERQATVGMRRVAPISARRADRVIAISNAAADDIVDTLGLSRDTVDVTPLGAPRVPSGRYTAAAALRSRYGLGDDPVVLCVAQKREHKNLMGLVQALGSMKESRARLVIPGSSTPHEAELRAAAAGLGIGDRLVLPEWLSDEDLEGLYRIARCFVLPSFHEGFGLPILEAMARGVPVACSAVSSLPEVAGDAALLFSPARSGEIASAIDRLLTDDALREKLRKRGFARVERFSWKATARLTLACYRRAIAQKRHSVRTR